VGEDFLSAASPQSGETQLYEALARLYRDKFHDHGAPPKTLKSFASSGMLLRRTLSAYELSYCEGREREATIDCALFINGARRTPPR